MALFNFNSNQAQTAEITNEPKWHVFEFKGENGEGTNVTGAVLRAALPEGTLILDSFTNRYVVSQASALVGTVKVGGSTWQGALDLTNSATNATSKSKLIGSTPEDITVDLLWTGNEHASDPPVHVGFAFLLYRPISP